MKITILYDNTSINKDLKPDWGFSCFIEKDGRNILFDTGGNGKILLENMETLGVEPASIDDIFISHQHFDHIGGLSAVLNENRSAKVHIPPSLRGIKYANTVTEYDKPAQIYSGIFTTGELKGIEQSLFIDTEKGAVVIIGCCHPGLKTILDIFQDKNIHAIIGGLHGSQEYDLMNKADILCPTHCTKHKTEIKKNFSGTLIKGGAGTVIKF